LPPPLFFLDGEGGCSKRAMIEKDTLLIEGPMVCEGAATGEGHVQTVRVALLECLNTLSIEVKFCTTVFAVLRIEIVTFL
jgi:hypothetical protein